jgi:predicted DCC family thiol-disulfide oxidoreductase YuxK
MSRITAWHDGDHPLCCREIAIMRPRDRRGSMKSIDTTGAEACPLDRAELPAEPRR